jgi:hypothetical protein
MLDPEPAAQCRGAHMMYFAAIMAIESGIDASGAEATSRR